MNALHLSVIGTLYNIFTHTIFYFLKLPTYKRYRINMSWAVRHTFTVVFLRALNSNQQQIHWRQIGKKYYSFASCFRHTICKNILIFDILFAVNKIDVYAIAMTIKEKLNWIEFVICWEICVEIWQSINYRKFL